jgi:three-Cys-motif partner protein
MSFYDEQTEQSRVKSAIVVAYFGAWARILSARKPKIGYVDLYCGPGQYKSGQKSTPLLILEKAIADPVLRLKLLTLFNDADEAYTISLQESIRSLPGIERLRYQPEVTTCEVDERYAQRFERLRGVPILAFIDPWGYKGVSKQLLRSLIKDFGCECIFLFNYNRINMAINNEGTEQHLVALLGKERLQELRFEVAELTPGSREAQVMCAVGEAVGDIGGKYLLTFRFAWSGGRPSHYICFVTKHPRGCEIMKDVMAKRGLVDEDGVPLFEFPPKREGRQLTFDCVRPLRSLAPDLLERFSGHTLTVKQIYENHHPGTPFIKPNYKRVLREMEQGGQIKCASAKGKIRKGTMADHVSVTFPPRESRR